MRRLALFPMLSFAASAVVGLSLPLPPSVARPRKAADPKKKAARKRQKKARAVNRGRR